MKKACSVLLTVLTFSLLIFSKDCSAQNAEGKFRKNKGAGQGWKKPSQEGNTDFSARRAERQQKWKEKSQSGNDNNKQNHEQVRQKWREKNQSGQSMTAEDRERKKAQWKEKWGTQNADKMSSMKEKWGQMRQQNPELGGLQERLAAFKAAKESGDKQAMQSRMQELREQFNGMNPETRANIQQHMPELASKLGKIPSGEGKSFAGQGSFKGPRGGESNWKGQSQFNGNSMSREGTVTGAGGKQAHHQSTHVKDGKTVQHSGQWNAEGKTLNMSGSTVKNADSVQTNKSWTNDSGKETSLERQTQKIDSGYTSTGNWTNSQGKSAIVETVAVRDGKTLSKDVTITTQDGKKLQASGTGANEKGHSQTKWQNDSDKTLDTSSDWVFDIFED